MTPEACIAWAIAAALLPLHLPCLTSARFYRRIDQNELRPDQRPGLRVHSRIAYASAPVEHIIRSAKTYNLIMYADSKNSLKIIVGWLEGSDDAEWEAQIESGEAAREDMERLARPDYHRGRGRGMAQGPQGDPNASKLNKAIPHVRAMLAAMRSRNRAAALEHGRLAMAAM